MTKVDLLHFLSLPPDADVPETISADELAELQGGGDQSRTDEWRGAVIRAMTAGMLEYQAITIVEEVRETYTPRNSDGRPMRTSSGRPIVMFKTGQPKMVESTKYVIQRGAVVQWLKRLEAEPSKMMAFWLRRQKETAEQREDRRLSEYLAFCALNGHIPPRNSTGRRNGIVACAKAMCITHQSLSADIKSALRKVCTTPALASGCETVSA